MPHLLDLLEEQLVSAAEHAPGQRGRRRRPYLPSGLAVAAALLVAAVIVASALLLLGGPDPSRPAGPTTRTAPTTTPLPGQRSGRGVFLLNGAGRPGIAAAAAGRLDAAGVAVSGFGSAPKHSTKSYVYLPGRGASPEAALDALGLAVTKIVIRRSPALDRLTGRAPATIVLGDDFRLPGTRRILPLSGPDGARGQATLVPATGGVSLAVDVRGVPQTNRLVIWTFGASGAATKAGFGVVSKGRLQGRTVLRGPVPAGVLITRETQDQPRQPSSDVIARSG